MNSAVPDRHALLAEAANPRRASVDDIGRLSRLLAAAFLSDPVMEYIARTGPKRAPALERFFFWLLHTRAVPLGEVWMTESAGAVAVWLPPGVPPTPGGFLEQLRLLPLFIRMCGFSRLSRGQAMGEAMEKHHPHERHYYLAFIAVAPRLQGLGLGAALLESNLKRIDAAGEPAYLENSNPKNTKLYTRAGFVARQNIAPHGAPPLIAMWRDAHKP